MYKYPIGLTQQFKMCGNPFRIDTYKGCDFNCLYCFASNRGGNFTNNKDISDIEQIKSYFYKAFESNKQYKNINIELLQHRVPLHLGGLSDPFQAREYKYNLTLELLKLTNKYNYPVLISTKTDNLPDKYFEILNPKIHAFQISLIGYDVEFIRQFENNTPEPKNRIKFIKLLKSKNFWVSLRMQPLIDLHQAEKVINQLENHIDYITIEHLKIALDNKDIKTKLFKFINKDNYKATGREYELNTEIKKANILYLKSITKNKIGCGDNDLHELSDSFNCCGIDCINDNFNNWLKYNSMNINMTNTNNYWYPKMNCQQTFNSACRKKEYGFKEYVDDYITKQNLK